MNSKVLMGSLELEALVTEDVFGSLLIWVKGRWMELEVVANWCCWQLSSFSLGLGWDLHGS